MALLTRSRKGYRLESTIRYSPFYNIHPLAQVIYYLACLTFTLMFNNPIYLVSILLTVILLGLMYEQPKVIIKSLKFYLIVSVFIVLINVISIRRGRNILFYVFGKEITLEALLYGIIMAISLMSVFLIFTSFNKIITQDRFLFVFSKISKRLAFILMMAIRWIPVLNKTAADINMIQTTKGVDYTTKNKRSLLKKLAVNLEILLGYSMENSMITAESMKARGYETTGKKRTFYFNYKLNNFDVLVLIVEGMLIAFNIYYYMHGYGEIDIYRKLTVESFWYVYLPAYISFLTLCFIPFLIELRGAISCMTSKLKG